MVSGRKGVVGMHLDRQVARSVDELYEQGELVPVCFVNLSAHQCSAEFLYQRIDCTAGEASLLHCGFVLAVTGYLPALADGWYIGAYSLVPGNLVASPYHGTKEGLKFQYFHQRL